MSPVAAPSILHTLLLRRASGRRLWTALGALSAGLALLLVALLLWWNFNELLHGNASKDDLGSSFLTIGRRVTAQNMGHPEQTLFSKKEIEELRTAPEVSDVGVVMAFRPQVYMRMQLGPGLGFSTDMVLEAVPDRFMDKRPAEWSWQPGNPRVPIILSSSFLSLYNYVFAPSRGMPQISEETVRAIPFQLDVGPDGAQTHYVAQVVGFSDRITSVLVPESFVQYANGPGASDASSRLIIKVKDPSSTAFAKFLETHDYVTNSELTRFSKLRGIVEAIALAIGALALLLLGVSLLLFVLFIELTIARASASIRLLLEIGYGPAALKRFLEARFVPLLGLAVGASVIVAMAAQLAAHFIGARSGLDLLLLPGWPIWVCVGIVAIMLWLILKRAIAGAMGGGKSLVVSR